MARSFWDSFHSHRWLLPQRHRLRPKKEDVDLLHSSTAVQAVRSYFLDCRLTAQHRWRWTAGCGLGGVISRLGQRLSVRQRIISTAQVCFKRIYTEELLSVRDPVLVSVVALFVACKVEEWQLNAKQIIQAINRGEASSRSSNSSGSATASTPASFPYGVQDVLSAELDVLQALGFDVVVFHPYRPLLHFLQPLQHEAVYQSLLQHSWWLLNDSYHTDLPLLHPPYLIAAACVYTACHLLAVDHRPVLKRVSVSTAAVRDAATQLLQLHARRDSERMSTTQYTQAAPCVADDGLHTPVTPSVLQSLAILRSHFAARRRDLLLDGSEAGLIGLKEADEKQSSASVDEQQEQNERVSEQTVDDSGRPVEELEGDGQPSARKRPRVAHSGET